MSTADSFDVVEATVGDVHAAMETGTITARGLVDRYRRRIEAYDDDLNATAPASGPRSSMPGSPTGASSVRCTASRSC
jgi:Asp-tRNA(Asn)/Glu-tRNA(Gln) amidotransferase A subunit family amidase